MPIDYTLYLVAGSHDTLGRNPVEVTEAAIRGGVTLVQQREKGLAARPWLALARELRRLTQKYGISFLINDRVDIAQAVGADGVHLGDDDLPVLVARRILGPDAIIGVSVDHPDKARKARIEGADYMGVGPMYTSPTKLDAGPAAGPELIRRIRPAAPLPLVGIGGITAETAARITEAGADGIAVISAVTRAADPAEAARLLRAAARQGITRYKESMEWGYVERSEARE